MSTVPPSLANLPVVNLVNRVYQQGVDGDAGASELILVPHYVRKDRRRFVFYATAVISSGAPRITQVFIENKLDGKRYAQTTNDDTPKSLAANLMLAPNQELQLDVDPASDDGLLDITLCWYDVVWNPPRV